MRHIEDFINMLLSISLGGCLMFCAHAQNPWGQDLDNNVRQTGSHREHLAKIKCIGDRSHRGKECELAHRSRFDRVDFHADVPCTFYGTTPSFNH